MLARVVSASVRGDNLYSSLPGERVYEEDACTGVPGVGDEGERELADDDAVDRVFGVGAWWGLGAHPKAFASLAFTEGSTEMLVVVSMIRVGEVEVGDEDGESCRFFDERVRRRERWLDVRRATTILILELFAKVVVVGDFGECLLARDEVFRRTMVEEAEEGRGWGGGGGLLEPPISFELMRDSMSSPFRLYISM